MPWLAEVPAANRAFGPETYAEQVAGQSVAAFVYVEVGVAPQFALLEARRAVMMARREPRLRGIVAAAPLEYGERARSYLDALRALGPLMKGVRRNLQDETDADCCLRPDFLRGIHLLAERDFSFDLCIRHHQMPAAIAMARQCPEVRFILDHLGKPAIQRRELDPWRAHLEQLAACPNVSCKLSGLVTEANLQQWRPEDLRPYIDHAVAVFGSQRLMFGSDWPVMLQATTYPRWVETLDLLIARLPPERRLDIWENTARRAYSLDEAS
jgi:L-fuconolactonase